MASYACPAGSERDDAVEGGEERYNIRYTFETSKYNNCNIHLKIVETLEHAPKTLEKIPETYLKTMATKRNIKIKHMQRMYETYATSR
jgi:hypothetical protein